MDVAKLIHLLHAQSLHFTRLDCFADRFEGALPRKFVEELHQNEEERRREHAELFDVMREQGYERSSPTKLYQDIRRQSAVNCWHQNEHESAGMWSQYLKSDDGVAVRSTYARLIDSFDQSNDDIICVGLVNYIDFEHGSIENFNNVLLPTLHKRSSFQHERELRAVVVGAYREDDRHILNLYEFPEEGADYSVDLDRLIDGVYVAPGASGWFKSVIESVVKKYGLKVSVRQSSLDAEPLW